MNITNATACVAAHLVYTVCSVTTASVAVRSLSGNGSHNSHKITLGVNWARLGSERDGEINKKKERGRQKERAWRTN